MNAELYNAASGMIVEERRLEMIANNLANASTTGYRAVRSFATIYRGVAGEAPAVVRKANAGTALAGSYDAPGPGPIRPTGRALDVALGRDELLVLRTPEGPAYTRAGSLELTSEGTLTDNLGYAVLDVEGNPVEGLGPGASIAANGAIVDGGGEAARLRVVRFDPAVLRRRGDNLLTAEGADTRLEPVDDPRLTPGYLEGSAADPLVELINLIESQRAFQGYQKLITLTMNDVNRKAVNEIAG